MGRDGKNHKGNKVGTKRRAHQIISYESGVDQNEVKEAVKRRRISKCSIERKKLFENEA